MADELLTFTVHGKPEPRGSKQPFVIYKDRKTKEPARREDGSIMVNLTDDNAESKAWMESVAWAARSAWKKPMLTEAALEVECSFFLRRPQSDFGTGRNARLLKDGAMARPAKLPDLDKLARGTLDALTGIVWRDDAQLVGVALEKRYAVPKSAKDDGQGVVITVAFAKEQVATDLPLDLRERWLDPGDDLPAPDDSLFAAAD